MRLALVIVLILIRANVVLASSDSNGLEGIRSIGLSTNGIELDGTGILIGQVEPGRPGRHGIDMPQWTHEQTLPTQVYAGTGTDSPNSTLVQGAIGAHATEVAGVMIAKGTPVTLVEGVAPNASLHSYGDTGGGGDNGKDFLAWQRGESTTPYSSGDLAAWQTAYNGGARADQPYSVAWNCSRGYRAATGLVGDSAEIAVSAEDFLAPAARLVPEKWKLRGLNCAAFLCRMSPLRCLRFR